VSIQVFRLLIAVACIAAILAFTVVGPGAAAPSVKTSRPIAPAPAGGTIPLAATSDPAALGGYNVLIADRGNNRLLLVSPQKEILWEYDFTGLKPGAGADDAFFTPDHKSIVVNLEHEQVIQIIDRVTKKVIWSYGKLGHPGSSPGLLNFPDDAYMLGSGNIIVADIRNCRILEITPDKHIVRQAGVTGHCFGPSPMLASPNGDKPLPGGHVLVSTIGDRSITELDEQWQEVLKLALPIKYPSDPQMTAAGNFLVASYTHPGRIIEINTTGHVVWDYSAENEGLLNRPSLAIELPNGNILANDDLNHRVIVIGKASRRIIWQYGVTHQPGVETNHLSIPDGLDIEKIAASDPVSASGRRME
jgi:hypothetical protein